MPNLKVKKMSFMKLLKERKNTFKRANKRNWPESGTPDAPMQGTRTGRQQRKGGEEKHYTEHGGSNLWGEHTFTTKERPGEVFQDPRKEDARKVNKGIEHRTRPARRPLRK